MVLTPGQRKWCRDEFGLDWSDAAPEVAAKRRRLAQEACPRTSNVADDDSAIPPANSSSASSKAKSTPTDSSKASPSRAQRPNECEVIRATEMYSEDKGTTYRTVVGKDEEGAEIYKTLHSAYNERVIWRPRNAMFVDLKKMPPGFVAIDSGSAMHGDPDGLFPTLRKAIDATRSIPGEERIVHTTKMGSFSLIANSRIFIEQEVWKTATKKNRKYILRNFDTVVIYQASNLDLQIWMGKYFFGE